MSPRSFIHDDFLLESDVAVDLYLRFARDLPIVDYHCHLSPQSHGLGPSVPQHHRAVARRGPLQVAGHACQRRRRAAAARGTRPDWEKFEAWARTVPETLRNPLYHWTAHGAAAAPSGSTPSSVQRRPAPSSTAATSACRRTRFTTLGLLRRFRVAVVCTTDDPTDSPRGPRSPSPRGRTPRRASIRPGAPTGPGRRRSRGLERVGRHASRPRPGTGISGLDSFLDALDRRHEAFHALGCRASDHGLAAIPAAPHSDADVAAAFDTLRSGRPVDARRPIQLQSALVHRMAVMDHARGWVAAVPPGRPSQHQRAPPRRARRGLRLRFRRRLRAGAPPGALSRRSRPARRPREDDPLQPEPARQRGLRHHGRATSRTARSPARSSTAPPGGSWIRSDGIEAQLRALSNMGLLSRFVGMVTDSAQLPLVLAPRLLSPDPLQPPGRGRPPRPRPRRPASSSGEIVTRIAFTNARDYFGFPLGAAAGSRA